MGYTQTGTPYYASPEVWKNQPYDYKSDVWSLGCVIYEMCKLIPPFQAKSMEDLYKKIIRGFYPQIPSKYSDDLKEIIKLMIQTEVGARPSCDELLKMTIIQKKIEIINKNLIELNNNSDINKKLLSTIRIPSEFSNFSRNLPKPKYFSPSHSEKNNKENIKNSNEDSALLNRLSGNKNQKKENLNLSENNRNQKDNNSDNKSINISNKNNEILSPIKKNNKEFILSENGKKNNKIPSLISPIHIKDQNNKEILSEKIILPEIKNNKNYRNYNSIEKTKLSKRIKIINNQNKIEFNSPYKVLQSENNINAYDKNFYKYIINIKVVNINDNQRIINNKNRFKNESPKNKEEKIKYIRENRNNLYNNCNNNIINRVIKQQYNIMKKYILHNK